MCLGCGDEAAAVLGESLRGKLYRAEASLAASEKRERALVHAVRDTWLSARTNDDTPPGCYLVDSEPLLRAHKAMIAALALAADKDGGR